MSTSNNSKMLANYPILCIPGVFANIKEERIRRVFGDLDLGEITRVDIIVPKNSVNSNEKENRFNRVFVHINWNDSQQSVACRERVIQGKDVKIIYDEPWFWRVSAYRPPAPKQNVDSQSTRPRQKVPIQPKKATIEIEYEPEIKKSKIIAKGLSIDIISQLIHIQPKSPVCAPPSITECIEEVKK